MHAHERGCTVKGCRCDIPRAWIVFGLGLFILALEIAGGMVSGSLALLSDAGHVLIDQVAIAVAIIVAFAVRRNRASERGLRVLGGWCHGALAIGIAVWIIFEALERLVQPVAIVPVPLIVLAAIGGIGNYLQHCVVIGGHHHLTTRGLDFHILSDLWQSVAVVAGGCAILLTGEALVDAALSFCIAGAIAFGGARLMLSAIRH